MSYSKPKLYLKVGDTDEVDVGEAVQGLIFLGDDESPVMATSYQQNVSQDGQLVTAINYDKSVINAKFVLHFNDWYDYKMAKHDVYRLFNQRSVMRIRTDAEPAIVKYVVPKTFGIAPIGDGYHDATFTIPFDNPSSYKYSLARSDNLYTYDSELWQQGMNLPNGQDLRYTFTGNSFRIFNASDIMIDPYYQNHDLKLLINFTGGSLKIVNKTTNTSWSYLKSAKKTDQIILDGIRTTLNGNPASVNTDYGNLTLAPGWNDISVTGATDMQITFSFPFIYLG